MRILSTVGKSYVGHPEAVEPMYLEFTVPLKRMGHEVDHFDHVKEAAEFGPDEAGARFERLVRYGRFDLVLYQTGGRDIISREAIAQASKYAPVVAWNSDDDWQWESYTRQIAPCFTRMITTYPHIYEQNRIAHPNLLLSQWGCLDSYSDYNRAKDLDFTFAGQIYSARVNECLQLKREAGLRVFGLGSIRVRHPALRSRAVYGFIARNFPRLNPAVTFEQINDVWNRSKISFTPMGASTNPKMLQIKSRTFEQGLSGTLMLCQQSPCLERYYEPGKEFIAFESLDECAEKATYYLRNERDRARIAGAYWHRTRAEHMWEHRFAALFQEIGLMTSSNPKRVAA